MNYTLLIHGILRWAVLLFGVWAVLAIVLKGVATLELATYQNTLVTQTANDAAAQCH